MDTLKNNKCHSFIANAKKRMAKMAVNVNVNVINNKEDEAIQFI